jgi:hypothetical protein
MLVLVARGLDNHSKELDARDQKQVEHCFYYRLPSGFEYEISNKINPPVIFRSACSEISEY